MICMRCIGTLEFVSDFHNKCHQTQQLLLEKESSQELAKDDIRTDFESDKENTLPDSNIETEKNISCKPAPLRRKSSRMEIRLGKLKRVKYKDDSKVYENTISHLDDYQNLKENEAYSTEIRHSSIELNNPIMREHKTRTLWDRSPLITDIYDHGGNGNNLENADVCTKPRSLRKTRGREGSNATTSNKRAKLSRGGISCSGSEQNTTIESNATKSGDMRNDKNVGKSSKENPNACHSLGRKFPNVAKEEINVSKRVPLEIVKMENFDSDNALVKDALFVESDKLAQVPNDVILKPDEPAREPSPESTAKSPRPGDEAGDTRPAADETSKIVPIGDDSLDSKGLSNIPMTRKSVIETVKDGKTLGVGTECGSVNKNKISTQTMLSKDETACQKNQTKLVGKLGKLSRSTTSLKKLSGEVSRGLNDSGRVENFRERRKKFEGQFGKLSELITNEQKEIIETLYTVNMAVVDDEEVHRNIKILDKVKAKCEICGKMYPRMDKCQVHVWGHLNMKPYCCKSCDFVTLTVSNIRCHIRKRHLKIKPFQCNLCEKTYGTAVLLEEHINSHTGAKPYKCKLCDFATSNRQVLSYHKTTHKSVKDISCEVCGKKFFSNCRMRAHMIVHNKDKALMCKFCSTYLCNAEALEKHYQKVHSHDYVCNICGVRTRSRKALTNHENVHSEGKYKCPLCAKVYKSKHMLNEHLLKHQGIRKYKCKLCEKSFAQQSHIAAHMSVHMGKRYPCPGCNKLFNRRDNMRIHTRRCRILESNPNAKGSWTSVGLTRPTESDCTSIATLRTSEPPSSVTKSMEKSKTDTEKSETGLGLIRINLLTGKTDYSNSHNLGAALRDSRDVTRDEGLDQFQSNDGGILRIGEVEIFPLSNPNVIGIQNEGNTVVTESVLEPECF